MITQLVPHVLAHGIGGVQDLPVPRWLFYWGGAFVLVVSFIALGALWKTPQLERHAGGRELGGGFSRLVLGPLRIVVQALSVVLFVTVLAAALFGTTDPFGNLAPTWVYVIFWVGLPILSLVFGNVWRALSPWRAIADGFVWVWELLGREARPLAAYPERFGRYPGAVALFAFVALELTYSNPSNPRALAFAIALYSYVALFGMLAFGRETWTTRGEGFAVLFAYIARIAPLVVREGRIRLRVPFTGLGGSEHVPGSVVFLAVALGSIGFDGYSRTISWQNLVARVEAPYVLNSPGTGELLVTGLNLLGLVAAITIVALRLPRRLRDRPLDGGGASIARARLRPLARADRARLLDRALLLALRDPGAVRDPAPLRPLRQGLGPLRHGRLPPEHRAADAEHDLVRPGRRARARPRGRPRGRARPGDRDLPRTARTRSAASTRCSG